MGSIGNVMSGACIDACWEIVFADSSVAQLDTNRLKMLLVFARDSHDHAVEAVDCVRHC